MRKYEIYGRLKRPDLSYPENSVDYIEYEIHQEKKSTGDGIDDFEVIDVEEEVKTNIVEFINSFEDQVGIDNILKRVALSGDTSLLNEKEALYADLTPYEDTAEAFKKAQALNELYDSIDPELRNGAGIKEFIENLTEEKIQAYLDKKLKEREEENENSKANV